MWIRIWLTVLVLAGTWSSGAAPPVHAACVVEGTVTYDIGTNLRDDKCDTSGAKKVTTGGSSGATGGTANAAAPTLTEGVAYGFSLDLAGNERVTLGTLLAGEDQANDLIKTSGGSVRVTQFVGTGGVPSTASDATTAALTAYVGMKTFQGVITCTGTCVQTQKIYGTYTSTFSATTSDLVCTITLNASTTDHAFCKTDANFSYWFVVTSLTGGTTPLAALFVYQ